MNPSFLTEWLKRVAGRGDAPRLARPWQEILGVCALAPLVCLGWYLLLQVNPKFLHIDLYPTYVAGSLWFQGQLDAIYHAEIWITDVTAHPAWTRELQSLNTRNVGTSFVYHPVYLWLMLPLVSALSLHEFALLFFVLNAISAIVVGSEAMRLAGVRALSIRGVGGLLTAFTFPAIYGAALGQNVMPAAALILMGFRALESGHRLGGVGLLLAAIAFKPWCVLVLPALLLLGWWRASAVGAVAYGLIYVLVPYVIAPTLFEGYRTVVARIVDTSLVSYNNVSLRGFLHRLSWADWGTHVRVWMPQEMPAETRLVEAALLGGIALAFLGVALWKRPDRRTLFVASFALLLLPLGVSWTHYFVMVVPITVCIVVDTTRRRETRLLALAQLGLLFYHYIPLPYHSASWSPDRVVAGPMLWAVYYFAPTAFCLAVVFAALLDPPKSRISAS